MRSGVIAQKLGMTRIYTEDGAQVPVNGTRFRIVMIEEVVELRPQFGPPGFRDPELLVH